jgi:hypothetical protein
MNIDRVFCGYMALIGLAAGALLVSMPAVQDFFIKPYFWILIAVGLFEIGTALYRRGSPSGILTMQARLIGFGIGIVAMVAIPLLAGSTVRFM